MSFAIPHFRDEDDLTMKLRAELAEVALLALRQQNGRPTRLLDEQPIAPVLTFPVLRQMPTMMPPLPAFQPTFDPTRLIVGQPGFIPTPNGFVPI